MLELRGEGGYLKGDEMKAKNFWTGVVILGIFLCGRGDARSEKVCGSEGGVIGVILEEDGRRGTITGNYGSAIYGGEAGYDCEEYIDWARRGAEIELLDPNVMVNEYGKPIVKVKAEETGWRALLLAIVGLPSETIGWVNLRDTSFAEWFEDKAKVGALPIVVGTIAEEAGRKGTVTGTYGCEIYGSGVHYSRRLNLGRASQGMRIELVERDVFENEFRREIIKIKALEASGQVVAGVVGWVSLSDTSFAEWYEGKGDVLRVERVIGKVLEKEGTKGTITGEHGASMSGSGVSYNPDLSLGRLKRGAQIELVDVKVIESKFGRPIIKVKALTGEWTVAVGSIGWVNLTATSFADRFAEESEGGSNGGEGGVENGESQETGDESEGTRCVFRVAGCERLRVKKWQGHRQRLAYSV